jgi:putative Mg2+ transporter-C (MgtC) family protein
MPHEIEILLRILLAVVLGAIIGVQRELANKPAGLRTHILICLGAALFTVVSIFGFIDTYDMSRVAAGVVAGIGFLGAGVIFRSMRGDVVVGLTTAASVWATAAVGIACGSGMYLIAAVSAIIIFLVLLIPKVKG